MGRRRTDSIDLACRAWAQDRRKILGLDECRTAREFLGALRSTLAARRDLHAGATSTGRVEQHWPEIYSCDEALRVAQAYHRARPELKAVLDVHYLARAPIEFKAEALSISPRAYWNRVAIAKAFVEAWLMR